jgi:hypothetical protein
MVNAQPIRLTDRRRQRGFAIAEIIVAMTILTLAVFPLAMSFVKEQKLCRGYYCKAVAMEIVDGEIEALSQGGWRDFAPGVHEYAARAEAAKNLPAGKFLLTLDAQTVRLEWKPEQKGAGGGVIRQTRIQ